MYFTSRITKCFKSHLRLNTIINHRCVFFNYNMMDELTTESKEPIVQYILVRTDLKTSLKWPQGAVMAQSCHACIAAIHLFYSHKHTQAYLKDLERMHKIILQIPDEATLLRINEELKSSNVDFHLWLEQPDNINTCIALRPYPKSEVENHFKSLKLYRN